MKALKQAINIALRDDSDATSGIRTLLGHAATPWGVHSGHFPEIPDFSSKSYLTWMLMPGSAESPVGEAKLRQQPFRVTAWSKDADKVEDILKRARYRLDNLKGVTLPTTDCELHNIKFDAPGPDLFDDEFKVFYRPETYLAFFREDQAWA